jgi:tetratricopeptide (TPR) repeat protein
MLKRALEIAVLATALLAREAGALPGTSTLDRALEMLRDIVYDNQALALTQASAEEARKLAQAQDSGQTQSGRDLVLARIDYFLGRAFKEGGDKRKALEFYDSSLAHARASQSAGETNPGLLAEAKALAELCSMRDLGFLVVNGPKVLQYAQKILDTEQDNIGAGLIQAQSKAYAPGIFGGDPAKAITQLDNIASSHSGSLEKDELFDLLVCRGVALDKLGRKADAKASFIAALGLYPGNVYARDCLAKVSR